jgi:hypothetical protein
VIAKRSLASCSGATQWRLLARSSARSALRQQTVARGNAGRCIHCDDFVRSRKIQSSRSSEGQGGEMDRRFDRIDLTGDCRVVRHTARARTPSARYRGTRMVTGWRIRAMAALSTRAAPRPRRGSRARRTSGRTPWPAQPARAERQPLRCCRHCGAAGGGRDGAGRSWTGQGEGRAERVCRLLLGSGGRAGVRALKIFWTLMECDAEQKIRGAFMALANLRASLHTSCQSCAQPDRQAGQQHVDAAAGDTAVWRPHSSGAGASPLGPWRTRRTSCQRGRGWPSC